MIIYPKSREQYEEMTNNIDNSKIYIIITTSLIDDYYKEREIQYINGINSVLKIAKNKYKIIIVENNGRRKTFLDKFGVEVNYTNNNKQSIKNKGIKEILDILNCIDKYHIKDNDFVVKITGRYILDNNSNFFQKLSTLKSDIHCMLKFGSYFNPVNYPVDDCITGLIGMRAIYYKMINFSIDEFTAIEWEYAKMIRKNIQEDNILILDKMGITMNCGSNGYIYTV